MRKQQQEPARALLSDVVQRGRPEPTGEAVVNLKRSFPQRHPYLLTGATMLLGAVAFFVTGYFGQASSVSFYPRTCLGSWDDVQKAEGKPDAKVVEEVGPHNAALLDRRSRDIYCGSFTGERPEGAALKSLTLQLSWAVSDERLKAPKVIVPSDEGGDATSVEQAIPEGALDAQTPSSAEFEFQDPGAGVTPAGEDAEAPSPESGEEAPGGGAAPEPEAAPEPAPAPEAPAASEPASWVFTRVLAQEAGGDAAPEPAPEVLPEPAPEPEPPVTAEEEPAPEPEADEPAVDPSAEPGPPGVPEQETGTATTTESGAAAGDAFLAIEYSLDGVEWREVKGVTRSNWQEPVVIPVSTWEEIETLQVRIQRIPELDDVPFVYLDAMELVAEYDSTAGMATPDFDRDTPVAIRSNDRFALVKVLQHSDNRHVLWLYERTDLPQWTVVATEDTMAPDSPVALRGSFVFWLSPDRRAVNGFDASARSLFSQSVASVAGQPVWLRFDGDREEIRVSGTGFTLVDVASGQEVSADDDLAFSTAFWERAKLGELQSQATSTEELAGEVASSTQEVQAGEEQEAAPEEVVPEVSEEAPAAEVPAAEAPVEQELVL